MKFYYRGKKAPSEGYDIASGCLLIIAISAIVFVFSIINDLEDLDEHWLEIIFITIMSVTTLFAMLRKKGKLHTYRIDIENNYLKMSDKQVKFLDIQFDKYYFKGKFERYHLWDSKGTIAIYSVYEDDLSKFLEEKYPNQTQKFEVTKSNAPSFEVSVRCEKRRLNYDLESGRYSIIDHNKIIISENTPNVFAYDGKYKLGKALLKKK